MSMISGSTSELSFIQIAAGLPALAWAISCAMCSPMRLRKVSGDTAIRSSSRRLGVAGDVVEDARDVAGDHRIGGEERQVGVDARGHRMIVAGADMDIGGERAAFAAHDQRQLGVGLELDEAEHDLRAGALERARPADIGLLVEARLELDQRGDRLAGLGRFDQRLDDRGFRGGAVERLLDGDHVGIARRLLAGTAPPRRRIHRGDGR